MDSDKRNALDNLREERTMSYNRLINYGEEFENYMNEGINSIEPGWTTAKEILESSSANETSFEGYDNNIIFKSIFNLLCKAEILPAWNDSPQYHIITDNYDPELLNEAYQHALKKEA